MPGLIAKPGKRCTPEGLPASGHRKRRNRAKTEEPPSPLPHEVIPEVLAAHIVRGFPGQGRRHGERREKADELPVAPPTRLTMTTFSGAGNEPPFHDGSAPCLTIALAFP